MTGGLRYAFRRRRNAPAPSWPVTDGWLIAFASSVVSRLKKDLKEATPTN